MIQKPSDKEQEYFVKKELEHLKRLREEHQKRQEVEEAQRLKELHFMHCPKCGVELHTITAPEGMEVDVCPACGGLWLDADELDRIVEARKRGPASGALERFRAWWKE
jgi:uncharacterized protein